MSPFGIPQDSDEEQDAGSAQSGTSPTDTLRNISRYANPRVNGIRKDRSSWKTLRDFVDERAIEDMLDRVESDRSTLDVSDSSLGRKWLPTGMPQTLLARTADHPEYLLASIAAIEDDMPAETSLPLFDNIFTAQEDAKGKMAVQLESLTAHYEQMSDILHEHEAGEELSEEDLRGM